MLTQLCLPNCVGPIVLAQLCWPNCVGPIVLAQLYWPNCVGLRVLARQRCRCCNATAYFGSDIITGHASAGSNLRHSSDNRLMLTIYTSKPYLLG